MDLYKQSPKTKLAYKGYRKCSMVGDNVPLATIIPRRPASGEAEKLQYKTRDFGWKLRECDADGTSGYVIVTVHCRQHDPTSVDMVNTDQIAVSYYVNRKQRKLSPRQSYESLIRSKSENLEHS